jgi:septum site-determining protein MinC
MLMEKSLVENGFIIDLTGAQNTSQLIYELSSIMEHPQVKGKNICLKLGKLELKQSQLLSIKALIESMDASIAFIDTTAEQTEASAMSLGIQLSTVSQEMSSSMEGINSKEISELAASQIKTEEVIIKTEDGIYDNHGEAKTIEIQADTGIQSGTIATTEGIDDIYDEITTQELTEVIPSEDYNTTDFGSVAAIEGLLPTEETSKYILLDTGNVLPEGIEENSANTEALPTLYINQTLRSGQTVSYEGNILIIGDAHPGSEIIAGGDITVWGILGGIAHAGNNGNITSKVRALKLNAIQLRIAGLYARRNDTLNVPYVQKSNEFTPEEALIENGKIVIYKKLRRD